jgi:integrase
MPCIWQLAINDTKTVFASAPSSEPTKFCKRSANRVRDVSGCAQQVCREDHWVIADLAGKGGHVRTVPVLAWVKAAIDSWAVAADIRLGRVFRAISKTGRTWGNGMTPKVLWEVVRGAAAAAGIENLAPHDLRRTCARLCHQAGGELDQIRFLLGHVSIQTTERYLGSSQKLQGAVNDRIGLEPDSPI